MRPRYRYVRFSVVCQKRRSEIEVLRAIQRTTMNTYGLKGLSEIMPTLLSFDEGKQEGTLRCARSHVIALRASLTMIREINGEKTAFHVTGVSGTIRALDVHQRT